MRGQGGSSGLMVRWGLVVLFSGFLLGLYGCASRKVSSAGSGLKGELSVLVDKGFRAEWVEGPGVVLVADENSAMPRSYVFLFSPFDRWKMNGLRARLLGMGALRVEMR